MAKKIKSKNIKVLETGGGAKLETSRQLNFETSTNFAEDRSFSRNDDVENEKNKISEENHELVFRVVVPKLGKLRHSQQQLQLPAHILLPE